MLDPRCRLLRRRGNSNQTVGVSAQGRCQLVACCIGNPVGEFAATGRKVGGVADVPCGTAQQRGREHDSAALPVWPDPTSAVTCPNPDSVWVYQAPAVRDQLGIRPVDLRVRPGRSTPVFRNRLYGPLDSAVVVASGILGGPMVPGGLWALSALAIILGAAGFAAFTPARSAGPDRPMPVSGFSPTAEQPAAGMR